MLTSKYPINPEHPLKEEHAKYYQVLEEIRKSGECNMWAADLPLAKECPELHMSEAKDILLEWIANYDALNDIFEWQ